MAWEYATVFNVGGFPSCEQAWVNAGLGASRGMSDKKKTLFLCYDRGCAYKFTLEQDDHQGQLWYSRPDKDLHQPPRPNGKFVVIICRQVREVHMVIDIVDKSTEGLTIVAKYALSGNEALTFNKPATCTVAHMKQTIHDEMCKQARMSDQTVIVLPEGFSNGRLRVKTAFEIMQPNKVKTVKKMILKQQ